MAQLRSELLKLRTTRTTLVLTLGMVALVLAATLGQGLGSDAPRSSSRRAASGSELGAIAGGTLAAGALSGGIGACLGALVRNQVGAIIGLLAWTFIAEGLLFGLAPTYGRYAPGSASNALSGQSAEHLLSTAAGGALLAGYLAAFAAAGVASMLRRDVP